VINLYVKSCLLLFIIMMPKSLKKTKLRSNDLNVIDHWMRNWVSFSDILFGYAARLFFCFFYQIIKGDGKKSVKNQRKILRYLVWKIKDTQIWREFNFDGIYKSEDIYSQFSSKIPIFEPSGYRKYVDLAKNEKNIVWPWKIGKFSISSWTTGNKKYIPVTKEAMKSTTKAWLYMFAYLIHRFPWLKIFRWDFFPLTWSIQESKDWMEAWDVSALILKARKWISASRYSLPEEVLLNPNWSNKLECVLKGINVYRENTMVWVTSRAYEILKYMESNDKKKFVEFTKNMELIIWWWVDSAPFMHYFKEFNINCFSAYNSAEWCFAFQDVENYDNINWDAPYMLLTNHWIFYEFLEFNWKNFDENWNIRKNAKAKPVWELNCTDVWKNFALIITTNGWLVRYLLWDVVSFVDDNLRFKIAWRTRQSINLKWEELMETHVNSVINKLSNDDGISITYYTIWPDNEDWPTCHEWVIECGKKLPISEEEFASKIDLYLQDINPDYKAKRSNNMLLKMPVIHLVKNWIFIKWMGSRGKLWAQNKVPKLSYKKDIINEIMKIS